MGQWAQMTDDDWVEIFMIVFNCAFYVLTDVSERGMTAK